MLRSALLLAALALPAFPQVPYGRIGGRVLDSSGAAVLGASLKVENIATGVATAASSDSQGNYEARNLIPGLYRLTAELPGFRLYERGPLELRVGEVLSVEVVMQPGVVTESVTVKDEAPLLDAAKSSLGHIVDSRRLLELPMPYSNAMYLNQLAPGVVSTMPPTGNWQSNQLTNSSSISVNGTATFASEYVLDGTPAMRENGYVSFLPPPEVLQEVRVESAGYDASMGHFSGAQINMVTKSGTNSFHAILNYEHNNRSLMTRSFFVNRAIYDTRTGPVTPDKINANFPASRMNWFRGVVSGPVYLPRLYNGRNRTFFTFAYTNFRRDFVPSVTTKTVPTLAERNGDFSALLAIGPRYQIYDPATIQPAPNGRFSRQPLPGNLVPVSRFDPVSRKLLDIIEPPNATGTADGTNNYLAVPVNHPRQPQYMVRLDHVVSQNHRFFVSIPLTEQFANTQPGNWMTDIMRSGGGSNFSSVTFDDVITAGSTVINLRYGVSRVGVTSIPVSAGYDLAALGLASSLVSQIDRRKAAFPTMQFSTFALVNAAAGSQNYRTTHTLSGSVARGLGKHNLRIGAEFRAYLVNSESFGQVAPAFSFTSAWTGGPLDNSPAAPVGQDFAAFLLGVPASGTIDRNASLADRSGYYSLFIHDDWKLTPKLTLNLGLRYERETPTTERYNRATRGFDYLTPSPIQSAAQANYAANPIAGLPAAQFRTLGGVLFAGVNGVPRGMVQTDTNNFSPRIGLSYQFRPKTVLRLGYGVFFETIGADRVDVLQTGFSQSTAMTPSLDNGLTFRATMSNPYPDGLLQAAGASRGLRSFLGQSVNFLWPGRRPGYSQRWSFNIQQELPSRVFFEVGYVGNRGTGLALSRETNALPQQYLSTSPVRDQPTIDFLSAAVSNPFFGIPEFTGSSLQARTVQRQLLLRPYPHFGAISSTFSAGYSWYHSLQLRAERRFANGYTIQGSYTWSKFMQATELQNGADPYPTHVISELDRPHNLMISGIWELPFGKNKSWAANVPGWLDHVLGGWSAQGIYHAQIGPPLAFGNVLFTGNFKDIALSGNQRTIDRWFNVDAGFNRVNTAQLASNIRTFPLRLSGVRAPGFNNFDLSAMKNFALTEKVSLQFRASAQDAFNHPVFGAPNTVPTSTAFGQITSTLGAGQRIVNVSARLAW